MTLEANTVDGADTWLHVLEETTISFVATLTEAPGWEDTRGGRGLSATNASAPIFSFLLLRPYVLIEDVATTTVEVEATAAEAIDPEKNTADEAF